MAGLSQSSVDYIVRQAFLKMAATKEPEITKEEFSYITENSKIAKRFDRLFLRGDMVYGVCKYSGKHVRIKKINGDKVVDLLRRKEVI